MGLFCITHYNSGNIYVLGIVFSSKRGKEKEEFTMSTFNAIGGIIFGTIILSVVWLIVMTIVKDQNEDKSSINITWIVVMALIIMVIMCLSKCS